MEPILILSLLISFFITLFFTPFWIKRAKFAGLFGKDMNKLSSKEVAEGGGVGVLFGFIFGVLVYIALKTFYFKTTENLITTFATSGISVMFSGVARYASIIIDVSVPLTLGLYRPLILTTNLNLL